jgi:hypothetical protein
MANEAKAPKGSSSSTVAFETPSSLMLSIKDGIVTAKTSRCYKFFARTDVSFSPLVVLYMLFTPKL